MDTPVLVVGGSLVGLSSAVFLSARGVKTVLVEPHLASSPHPRAMGFTPRTIELLDRVGMAGQLPAVPSAFRLRRAIVDSLAGRRIQETDWTPETKAPRKVMHAESPSTGAGIAQDRLEPLLRDRARELGADLRLGTKLVHFTQDADGVTARLEDIDGREYELRCAYMVAADGNRSTIREALGITRRGPGIIRVMRSVLFRAPVDEYLKEGISQFEIRQPGLAAFLTTYRDNRWVLMFHDDVERDDAQLLAAIKAAIGREDVPIEIITTGRWELTALVADRFSEGRVFLAGDSAHTLPPTRGGYGANTGIHDAHNLAWKIEAVLAGGSMPSLLDTYDAERRPVAWNRLEQTFARPDYAAFGDGFAAGVEILDATAMELGELYRSSAVIGASDDLPRAALPTEWRGQPGTRAPHVIIERGGRAASTLDLFQRGWMLLTPDAAWQEAADQASAATGIGIDVAVEQRDFRVDDAALRTAFGLGKHGATLIRPDGYIAWRSSDGPADARALGNALSLIAAV